MQTPLSRPLKNRLHSGCLKLALLTCIIWLPSPAHASDSKAKHVFDTLIINWENDVFAGTDRYYTNGILATLSTPYLADEPQKRHMPGWSYPVINRLPFVSNPAARRAATLSFGQLIFTPENVLSPDLVTDDRPYAGYLFGGVGFNSLERNRLATWQFNIGVVGPASLAQETSDFIHRLFGGTPAQGWENQLANEPALEAIYETKWRVLDSQNKTGFGHDLISHAGGRLGNVAVYANGGAEYRLGWHLPKNFGSSGIRTGVAPNPVFTQDDSGNGGNKRTSLHFFGKVDGRLVIRDIFLDGNTFKTSHKVDKESLVADLMMGVAWYVKRYKFSFAYTLRSREFENQRVAHTFGSLSLAFTY